MTPDLFTAAASRSHQSTTSTGKRTRTAFNVYEGDGNVRTITPAGRDGWALGELIAAGAAGITSLENPAPRLASYVHKLRTVYGLNVETITEMHGGDYAGKHARYRLHTRVEFAYPATAARAGVAP
jgi:hypothetical protein